MRVLGSNRGPDRVLWFDMGSPKGYVITAKPELQARNSMNPGILILDQFSYMA